jgi:hypothetical protein
VIGFLQLIASLCMALVEGPGPVSIVRGERWYWGGGGGPLPGIFRAGIDGVEVGTRQGGL